MYLYYGFKMIIAEGSHSKLTLEFLEQFFSSCVGLAYLVAQQMTYLDDWLIVSYR